MGVGLTLEKNKQTRGLTRLSLKRGIGEDDREKGGKNSNRRKEIFNIDLEISINSSAHFHCSFPFVGLFEGRLPVRDFLVLGHVFAAHATSAEADATATVVRSREDALLNRSCAEARSSF